ncbi:MAG: DUF2721 domain-containing protein, partial [Burkholderiales bacterium]|nr:DUF2721 domain-containing protein [Burkholderiales bacterium]
YRDEMAVLYLRRTWINRAITQSTLCGLLICLVVASLFLGSAFSLALGQIIAGLFVFAMLALIGSFICFLREIIISGYHRAPPPEHFGLEPHASDETR